VTVWRAVSRRNWRIGWGVLVAWAVFVIVAVAFGNRWIEWPDRWNPWAPLWPQERPNVLTPYKLSRLSDDPKACAVALAATTLSYTNVPDRPLASGCGWNNAARVTALPEDIGAPLVLSCPAAVSLAMWKLHSLQPAAEQTLGARVVALQHFGSYSCRDIARRAADGRPGEHRSEHASANAIDVAAFVLADGRTISVARDWQRPADHASRRFLQSIRDDACGIWNVVLGPDYNIAHRDHFHLDRGPYRACR
jgi:hypothetical protein